jgi:hypothetical protein
MMYVLWDMKDDSIEGLCFVSRSLEEVAEYTEMTERMGLGWSQDRKVCVLMPVEVPPVLGPVEPPGSRLHCPNCGLTEWATISSEISFRLIQDGEREDFRWLLCPCGLAQELRFE